MEQIKLKAVSREELGHKVKQLRKNGQIPAVVYGRDFETLSISVDAKEFEKVYRNAGTSTIVTLDLPENSIKVLLHEPQRNPVTDKIIHVDLYKVNMKQEIHTDIPLEFIGASPAVEDLEGSLITAKDALEIECLPDKLVSHIEVDLSALKTFEDVIKVGDINIPEGIKVLNDPEEMVAQVAAPRSEEELEGLEQTTAAEEEKAQIENMEAQAEAERAEKAEEGEEKAGEESKE